MEDNFILELERLKKPVWRVLQRYLPNAEPSQHYQMVRDYPSRQGKYLRPGLLLLSTEMLGGSQENALLLAAAIQASEEWLLIHDDVEDHSLYRRSTPAQPRPTLHVLHGEELAVNAGDALHIIMWRIVGDAVEKMKSEVGWKIFQKFNDILLTTTEGQFLDLSWVRNKVIKVSPKDYLKMVSKKCGYYTIVGPLQLGAMAAGHSSSKILNSMAKWGIPLGYAFQIRDDLNNLTQDSEVMGKEQGGDILEGKRTLLLIYLLEKCTKEESEYVRAIYRKERPEKTNSEKDYVLQLMARYGSFEHATKAIKSYCRVADREFRNFGRTLPKSKARETLRSAIDFIGSRAY